MKKNVVDRLDLSKEEMIKPGKDPAEVLEALVKIEELENNKALEVICKDRSIGE